MTNKQKYKVFTRRWYFIGDVGELIEISGTYCVSFHNHYNNSHLSSEEEKIASKVWKEIGTTFAVSKAKAIQNIKYREHLDSYEHDVNSRTTYYDEFKAELA